MGRLTLQLPSELTSHRERQREESTAAEGTETPVMVNWYRTWAATDSR